MKNTHIFFKKREYLGYYLKVSVFTQNTWLLVFNKTLIQVLAKCGHLWFQVLSVISYDRNTTEVSFLIPVSAEFGIEET